MSLREHEVAVQFESAEAGETVEKGPRNANPKRRTTQYLQVEPGIYQDQKTKEYFERPWLSGKRTWRPLKGKNIKLSREEHYRRKTAISRGKDPYALTGADESSPPESTPQEQKPSLRPNPQQNEAEGPAVDVQSSSDAVGDTEAKAMPSGKGRNGARKKKYVVQAATVGEVIRKYQTDGYLDRHLLPRPPATQDSETRHCKTLLGFWEFVDVAEVSDMICDEYRDWRIERVQQGEGLRTIDRELNTLNNSFRYGKRRGIVKVNFMADRPKYQPSSRVRHCREFMPRDANDLHEIAVYLAPNRHSQVLLFQATAEAYSGLRTCEILKWKANAKPGEFGYVTPDGKSMLVWRCKGQHLVNPYIRINEGMEALLKAHKKWHDKYYPDNEWFFPGHGKDANKPVDKGALSHALRRISKKRLKAQKNKVISHGMRAWYVTVRRSWGTPDNKIAFEIGHQSGGKTMAEVYGGVPPHWLEGEGPKMSWLPDGDPAWSAIKLTDDAAAEGEA